MSVKWAPDHTSTVLILQRRFHVCASVCVYVCFEVISECKTEYAANEFWKLLEAKTIFDNYPQTGSAAQIMATPSSLPSRNKIFRLSYHPFLYQQASDRKIFRMCSSLLHRCVVKKTRSGLNIKMSPYRHRNPHVKDKTVSRPSYL